MNMRTQFLTSLCMSFLFSHCLLVSSGQALAKSQSKAEQDELNRQLFPGASLPTHYRFTFKYPFRECVIPMRDKVKLNGLLFKSNNPKGVILYLHGSNNALNIWGKLSPAYTQLQYDVLMIDYRGYGKSGGKIISEGQLHQDMQTVYDYVKRMYPENQIIILGHSMGTGLAARLASVNKPRKLILQAPYYSVTDWVLHLLPSFDTTLIAYKLPTYQFLRKTASPVLVIHGDADQAIYCGSSLKLEACLKPSDQLIILKGEGHTEFVKNRDYKKTLQSFLR